MKRILNALFVGALMAATMAFGPPALASPEMGNDLIAAYNQNTPSASPATVQHDFASYVSSPATAGASARSTLGGEPLTYSPTNPTACEAQHTADALGVVGPGWRSAILRD